MERQLNCAKKKKGSTPAEKRVGVGGHLDLYKAFQISCSSETTGCFPFVCYHLGRIYIFSNLAGYTSSVTLHSEGTVVHKSGFNLKVVGSCLISAIGLPRIFSLYHIVCVFTQAYTSKYQETVRET